MLENVLEGSRTGGCLHQPSLMNPSSLHIMAHTRTCHKLKKQSPSCFQAASCFLLSSLISKSPPWLTSKVEPNRLFDNASNASALFEAANKTQEHLGLRWECIVSESLYHPETHLWVKFIQTLLKSLLTRPRREQSAGSVCARFELRREPHCKRSHGFKFDIVFEPISGHPFGCVTSLHTTQLQAAYGSKGLLW